MKVISNTDYDKIVRLLPKILEGIDFKSGIRQYEAARQLKIMLEKWKRNTKE